MAKKPPKKKPVKRKPVSKGKPRVKKTPPAKLPKKKPTPKKRVAKPQPVFKKPAKALPKKHIQGTANPPAKKKQLPKKPVSSPAGKLRKPGEVKLIEKHGFVGLAEVIAEEVKLQFRDALERLKAKLGGEVYVFVNRQFHVDAQWLFHVPRGVQAGQVVLQVEDALRRVGLRNGRKKDGGGTWIVSGFRFPASKLTNAANYDRWKKLLQVIAWPRRWNNRHFNFASLRKYLKTVKNKRYRKPEMVFVKLHWNVDDIKPTREEVV